MKLLLGLLLLFSGIALGIWLGIWICLIGGISQLINSVKVCPVNSMGIAIGLAKIFVSAFVGWLTFLIISGAGIFLISES